MADQDHSDQEGKLTPNESKREARRQKALERGTAIPSNAQSDTSPVFDAQGPKTPDQTSCGPKKKESITKKLKKSPEPTDSLKPSPEATSDIRYSQHTRIDLGSSLITHSPANQSESSKKFSAIYTVSDFSKSNPFAVSSRPIGNEERPGVHKFARQSSKSALDCESQLATAETALEGKMHVGDNEDVSRISTTVSENVTCAAPGCQKQDDDQGSILSEMPNARNRISLILKMPSETDSGKKRIPVEEECYFVDTLKWTYISERLLQDVNRHMKNMNYNVSLHVDKHKRIILRTEHLNGAEAELFARHLIWDILITFSSTLIYVAVDESDSKLDSFPPHFVQVYCKGKLFIVCDRGHACQLTHILGQRVVTVQLQFPKALRKLNVKCIDDLPCEGSDQTFLNCLMSGTIADVLPKIESVVPYYVRECTFHDFIREQLSNLNIAGELDGILNDANLTCVSEFANKTVYVYGFEEESVLKACELVQKNITRCKTTLPPSYDNSQCAKVLSEHKLKSGGKYVLYMRGNVIVAIGLAKAIAIGFDCGKDRLARASASFTGTVCGKTSQSPPPELFEGDSDNPVTKEDTTSKGGDCVDAVSLSTTSTRTRSSTKQKSDNIRMWEIKSKTLILNMNRVDKIDTDYVLTRPQASERDHLRPYFIVSIPDAKSSSLKTLLDLYRTLLASCKKEKLGKIALSLEEMNNWTFSEFSKVVVKAALETLQQCKDDSPLREIILCADSKKKFEAAVKTIDTMINFKGCQTYIVVVADQIERTKADVIVNSTSRHLELKRGKVSKSLLDAAGPHMQKECRDRYPQGLRLGEFAVTKGYKLKCHFVLHIALDVFNSETSYDCLENIKSLILGCLCWANDKQMKSIAFPALGTGKLKYPPDFVCNAMFESVNAFRTMVTESMKDATLLTVQLIIHPNDHDILQLYRSFAEKHEVQKTIQKSEEIKHDKQGTLNACKLVVIDMPQHTYAALKQFFGETWSEIEAMGVKHGHDQDGKLTLTGTENTLGSAADKIRAIYSRLQLMTYQRFSGKLSVLDTHQVSNWNGVLCYEDKFTKVKDVYTETGNIMTRIESLMKNPTESNQRIFMEGNCDKKADNAEKEQSTQGIVQSPEEEEVKCHDNSSVANIRRPANASEKDISRLEAQPEEILRLKDNSCVHGCIDNDLDNDSDTNTVRETAPYVRQTSTSSNSSVKNQVETADGDMKVSRDRPDITIQGRFKINGIRVVICHGDILKANVDCIVNAANKDLQHNGGIAGSIAAAAGNTIWDESEIIRMERGGPLATGDVVMTGGGKLPFCILHAVGPCWYDYDSSDVVGIQKCADDLKKTVLNCLENAERNKYATIAIPSISSGLFGVPEELCAVQYANAVLQFKGGAHVQEILFVDINPKMTKLIMSTFDTLVRQKKTIAIDCSIYVEKPTKSKQGSNDAKSLKRLHSSSCIYEGSFTGSVSLKIHVGDITRLDGVHMIVCSENTAGANAGTIARQLFEFGGEPYRRSKSHAFHEKKGTLRIGDIVITDGGKLCFKWVMHVIVPKDQMPEMHKLYRRIFKKSSRHGVSSVAVPLLGTAHGQFSAEESISALLIELEKFSMKYQRFFEVNVVIVKEDIASGIRDVVDKFVADLWESRSKDTPEVSGRRGAPVVRDSSKDDVSERRGASAECSSSKDDLTGSSHGSIQKGSIESSLRPNTTATYKTILTTVGNALLRRRPEPAECDSSKEELMKCHGSIHKDSAAASLATADTTISTVVKPEDKPDDCVICMDVPTIPKKLKCGHIFCKDCIESLFKIKPSCPICGAVCGVICGDQPNGSMIIEKQSSSLAGFEDHDSISMCYRFPDSRQGPNNPQPGTFVRGITRIGYLPDNKDGRLMCAMLAVAFQRRLVFTIGSSRTTGEEGVITWNDIHHKTDLRPNTQFGYPDPTYLQRVGEELAAKGVTEEDVKSLDRQIAKFINKKKETWSKSFCSHSELILDIHRTLCLHRDWHLNGVQLCLHFHKIIVNDICRILYVCYN